MNSARVDEDVANHIHASDADKGDLRDSQPQIAAIDGDGEPVQTFVEGRVGLGSEEENDTGALSSGRERFSD